MNTEQMMGLRQLDFKSSSYLIASSSVAEWKARCLAYLHHRTLFSDLIGCFSLQVYIFNYKIHSLAQRWAKIRHSKTWNSIFSYQVSLSSLRVFLDI